MQFQIAGAVGKCLAAALQLTVEADNVKRRAASQRRQQGQTGQPEGDPAEIGGRWRLRQEAVKIEAWRQHADFGIGVGNMLPASAMHVADRYQIVTDHRDGFFGFEFQVLGAAPVGIARAYQRDDFIRMLGGVFPTAQTGSDKGLGPLTVAQILRLAGEQHVAIEIDAGCPRAELDVWELPLVEQERLEDLVGRQGVGAAGHQ